MKSILARMAIILTALYWAGGVAFAVGSAAFGPQIGFLVFDWYELAGIFLIVYSIPLTALLWIGWAIIRLSHRAWSVAAFAVYGIALPCGRRGRARRVSSPTAGLQQRGERLPRELVHGLGELDVAVGQSAGIVGRQCDLDGFVNIEPFGVVIELFRHQRGARHETEGRIEIGKNEFFGDGVAILDLAPSFKTAERSLARFAGEFLTHVRSASMESRLARRHSRSYARKSPPGDRPFKARSSFTPTGAVRAILHARAQASGHVRGWNRTRHFARRAAYSQEASWRETNRREHSVDFSGCRQRHIRQPV